MFHIPKDRAKTLKCVNSKNKIYNPHDEGGVSFGTVYNKIQPHQRRQTVDDHPDYPLLNASFYCQIHPKNRQYRSDTIKYRAGIFEVI